MIRTIPAAIPISDIKNDPGKVIRLLGAAPVLLTQRGTSVAVLTSLAAWNEREQELARLQRILRVDEALARVQAGDYEVYDASAL